MDPTTLLRELLDAMTELHRLHTAEDASTVTQRNELRDGITSGLFSLDEWMRHGGFPPVVTRRTSWPAQAKPNVAFYLIGPTLATTDGIPQGPPIKATIGKGRPAG